MAAALHFPLSRGNWGVSGRLWGSGRPLLLFHMGFMPKLAKIGQRGRSTRFPPTLRGHQPVATAEFAWDNHCCLSQSLTSKVYVVAARLPAGCTGSSPVAIEPLGVSTGPSAEVNEID